IEAGETFTDFLDAAALVSDADQFEGKPGVTLITLHSTKGLEFDHVFLTGMEEGICPHNRAMDEDKGIEEERRLVYVGMTRARKAQAYPSTSAAPDRSEFLRASRCKARWRYKSYVGAKGSSSELWRWNDRWR